MKPKDVVLVVLFFLIISSPLLVGAYNKCVSEKIEIELFGYSDQVEEAQFSFSNFISGQYQKDYCQWFESTMATKGFWVKNYSSFQYYLFGEANNPVGREGYIYDDNFLSSELCIKEIDDYSSIAKQEEMKTFVNKINQLNELLKANGKSLLIYTIPGKANIHNDKIPYDYKLMSEEKKTNALDVFINEIKETDVDYIYCGDYINEIDYPLYYSTGIHWSRIYEQYTSRLIVDRLSVITGNLYRNFDIIDVETSKEDFYRDNDLYELMNIWGKSGCNYYQYVVQPKDIENTDKLRMLLYGDSFALGLRKDILDNFPTETIYYVNRNDYVLDSHDNFKSINQNFNNMNIKKILDNTDIVVLEFVDGELKNYSYGFVDYLIDYISQNGIESKCNNYCLNNIDLSINSTERENIYGLYNNEDGFVWTAGSFEITLDNTNIVENGLRITYRVPLETANGDKLTFYANGKKIIEKIYNEPCDDTILISPSDINASSSLIDIYGTCSKTFCPCTMGLSSDERILGVQLIYVGEQ